DRSRYGTALVVSAPCALMVRSIAARGARRSYRSCSALRCVLKHEGARSGLVLILRDARTPGRVCGASLVRVLLRMRTIERVEVLFTFQTADLVPAARFFAPGFCFWLRATPAKGWGAAESRPVLRSPRWGLHRPGQPRRLARRFASHDGGRPPLGAHTVAILGSGPALPSPAFAPDRLQRAPRARVVVPGWRGPVPPGAAVANRRRGTPRLAPPSGCLLTTPFDERGCESLRCALFPVKRKMCLIAAAIRRRLESRA